MKNKFSKIALLLLGLVGVFALTFILFDSGHVMEFLFGGSGVAMAELAAGATSVTSETPTTTVANEKSDLLRPKISQKITWMKPNQTPMDTIIRQIPTFGKIGSWEYKYYNAEMRGINDTLASPFDTSASGTFSSETGEHTITVTNPHIWNVHDNILFQDQVGSDGKVLIAHITGKNTSNATLNIVTVNGLGDAQLELPDMITGQKITRLNNTKSELAAQTSPYAIYPESDYNYAQRHMVQIEESVYHELHSEKEVPWGMAEFKMMALYDMRRSMELAYLFGARRKMFIEEEQAEKYFTGGITRFISKGIEYTDADIDNEGFISWCENIFTGNAGSETRVLFAGKTLLSKMAYMPTVNKQLEANSVELKWGLKFSRIESIYGELLVKYHPLFDEVGWADHGLVLDFAHIEHGIFEPMKTRDLDLIGSGQKNVNAKVISESSLVATRFPATHAIIYPAASSGA